MKIQTALRLTPSLLRNSLPSLQVERGMSAFGGQGVSPLTALLIILTDYCDSKFFKTKSRNLNSLTLFFHALPVFLGVLYAFAHGAADALKKTFALFKGNKTCAVNLCRLKVYFWLCLIHYPNGIK